MITKTNEPFPSGGMRVRSKKVIWNIMVLSSQNGIPSCGLIQFVTHLKSVLGYLSTAIGSIHTSEPNNGVKSFSQERRRKD
jgi:hypothetical protein